MIADEKRQKLNIHNAIYIWGKKEIEKEEGEREEEVQEGREEF